MGYRIRIIGGGWVRAFDPDWGRSGRLAETYDAAQAHVYPTQEAAWAAWRAQSRSVPLRPDGKPNRPMTAFTVVIEPVE